MPSLQIVTTFILVFILSSSEAQHVDSTLDKLQQIPTKYIKDIDKKVTQYTDRITYKTEKTLNKLSRWENKIHALLQKVNPEASNRLFGNNQLTFSSLLEQLKKGEAIALQYQTTYNKYRDDVTTSLEYLAQQKEQVDSGLIKKIKTTSEKMEELAIEEDKSEALQQFIKERKKQLIDQAFQYIGKNKYLIKINKEAYYYAETLKNYKELFSDSKKAETTVRTILSKIPAFQTFIQKNSMLARLFGAPGDIASTATLAGLQTRVGVQSLIQDRIAAGGPNAQQLISQNLQAAQSQLNQLKTKLINAASGGGNDIADFDFKPDMEKTKTFKQRFEFGTNFQSAKSNTLMLTTMDMALTVGYKLSDKSVIGIGAGYKLGLGSSITKIKFTNQGMSLRSFLDWRLKKQLFISGGMEMNYLSGLSAVQSPQQIVKNNDWQQSALLGLSKKFKVKTKWFKETKLQLMYDFLSRQHVPVSQPVVFRVGHSF